MVDEKGQSREAPDDASAHCGQRAGEHGPGRIVCFGGAAIDRTYAAHGPVRAGTSNPVTGASAFGGVARNVAVNLARLAVEVGIVSVVGDDEGGRSMLRHLGQLGVDCGGVRAVPGRTTAEYIALLHPDRSLALGMADMAILDAIALDDLSRALRRPGSTAWIFADGNLRAEILGELVRGDVRGGARLAIDAVSVSKAGRLPARLDGIDLLFLNRDEAAAVLRTDAAALSPETAARDLHERGARAVVLTLGARGLVFCDKPDVVSHLAAVPAEVVDVTGAGDALIAATLALRLEGASLSASLRAGMVAAALTVGHPGSTHPGLSRAALAAAGETLPSRRSDLRECST